MNEPVEKYKEYSGAYSHRFESLHFTPCNGNESYWAEGFDELIRYDLRFKYTQLKNEQNYIFMRIKGELSEEGKYGHLDMYNREIVIHEILEAKTEVPDTCLKPYKEDAVN
ncbi:hypothetical protein [Aliikangiella sp. IMCC44359]|uniref:hypothetical protein n=1 Tax=Aliikangiella sp. IMCC44359 TaxID=3459125 RepID=UPI00403A9B55